MIFRRRFKINTSEVCSFENENIQKFLKRDKSTRSFFLQLAEVAYLATDQGDDEGSVEAPGSQRLIPVTHVKEPETVSVEDEVIDSAFGWVVVAGGFLTQMINGRMPVYLSVCLYGCLPVSLSFFLYVYLCFCLSVPLSFCLSVCLFFCLSSCHFSIGLSACLFVFLSVCLPVCLAFYLSAYLSFCLSVCLRFLTYFPKPSP